MDDHKLTDMPAIKAFGYVLLDGRSRRSSALLPGADCTGIFKMTLDPLCAARLAGVPCRMASNLLRKHYRRPLRISLLLLRRYDG